MKRALATCAATLVILAVPGVATAVSVSSNDGSGTQYVSTWYPCGARTSGTLRSTQGNPVYYHGATVYDGDFDADMGRYTTNTSSTSSVSKGGLMGGTGSCPNHADGAHMKVCRDRSGMPDPCGNWSTTIRRP